MKRAAGFGLLVVAALAAGSKASGARACPAPLSVAPADRDVFIDQAMAAPAAALGAWAPRPMRGPFATSEEAAPACRTAERVAARPPFTAIERCVVGDPRRPLGPDNQSRHLLLVRTARGFWSEELARETWPHGDPTLERPRVASVGKLTATNRLGDAGVEITAIAEDGPPEESKSRRLFVCGVGPSGVPACADIRFAAGGPFHDAGSLLYRIDLDCSGHLAIAGWEGGRPVKLVHAEATLAFP